MKKLNILFIASGKNMGLSFNFSRLAIALEEIGHEVVVVSEPGEEEKDLLNELKRRRMKHFMVNGLDSLSAKNTIGAARILGRITDCENVDVIHAQGVRQLLVTFLASKFFCRKEKVGIVVSIHTTLAGSPYENLTLLVESLLLNMCADLTMPVAKSVANNLVSFGLIPNKVVPVYNGIDLELIDEIMHGSRNSSLLPDDLKDSSVIVVGYFARLDPNKGHRYLIRAVSDVSRSVPNIRLLIAGDGQLKGHLESLSKHLGIEEKVLFIGKVGHKSVYELLKRVDIYAFPSCAELFPFAILEAMAAGKPIVASSVGGVLEVVKHGETGLLVPPRDSDGLAEAIKNLISNPVEAEQMGKKCRKLIERNFTLNNIACDLTRCYELVVKRKFHG